jgi:hypothetical protein
VPESQDDERGHEKDVLGHVSYEVEMLVHCARRLIQRRKDRQSVLEHNVYVESFLLHARVLDDFFGAEPKDDDVTAGSFVTHWRRTRVLSCPERFAINKSVAHPTTARLAHRDFKFVDITTALVLEFKRFSGMVAAEMPGSEHPLAAAIRVSQEWMSVPPVGATTSTSVDDVEAHARTQAR